MFCFPFEQLLLKTITSFVLYNAIFVIRLFSVKFGFIMSSVILLYSRIPSTPYPLTSTLFHKYSYLPSFCTTAILASLNFPYGDFNSSFSFTHEIGI